MPRELPPIDDDIYQYLQTQAVPLEDDINSVLRRLLGLSGDAAIAAVVQHYERRVRHEAARSSGRKRARRAAKRTRAQKGSILPEEAYQLPILRALRELGGRAPSSEVIERVGKLLKAQLTDEDHKRLASGETRWRNRTQFVRLALIKTGDMNSDSPRGTWEISEQGRHRAAEASA